MTPPSLTPKTFRSAISAFAVLAVFTGWSAHGQVMVGFFSSSQQFQYVDQIIPVDASELETGPQIYHNYPESPYADRFNWRLPIGSDNYVIIHIEAIGMPDFQDGCPHDVSPPYATIYVMGGTVIPPAQYGNYPCLANLEPGEREAKDVYIKFTSLGQKHVEAHAIYIGPLEPCPGGHTGPHPVVDTDWDEWNFVLYRTRLEYIGLQDLPEDGIGEADEGISQEDVIRISNDAGARITLEGGGPNCSIRVVANQEPYWYSWIDYAVEPLPYYFFYEKTVYAVTEWKGKIAWDTYMLATWNVQGFGDVDSHASQGFIDCLPRELGDTGQAWSGERFHANGERPLNAYPLGSNPGPLYDPWVHYNGNYGMEVNVQRKSGVDKYDWYRYSPRREYNFQGEPAPPPEQWTPSLHESGYSISAISGGPNDGVWYLNSTNIALWHGYLINCWFNREAPLPPSPLQPNPIVWHYYNLAPTWFPNEPNVDTPPTVRPVAAWKQAIINHESFGDQGTIENANGHHARCVVAKAAHFRPSYRPEMCCDAKEYLEKVIFWQQDPGQAQFGMVICVLFTVKEGAPVENNLKTYAAGDMHDGIHRTNDPSLPISVPPVVPNWPWYDPNNFVYVVDSYGASPPHWWYRFKGGGDL